MPNRTEMSASESSAVAPDAPDSGAGVPTDIAASMSSATSVSSVASAASSAGSGSASAISIPAPSKLRLPGLVKAKPSGIKPPSKIGRPCDGLPKAAPIPPNTSQNASVILTEDTDSFIIGDRVWVGGTKPGQIAYIGDTQFAPGEWAGVVLDDPIGKNDGSVGGVRYFQCEPKKGVFSRLTRLTRYPLPEGMSPISPSIPLTRKATPTLSSTPSPIKSPTPAPALSPAFSADLKLGERVIVMSSQTGSKAGILRFKGPTDFAPGEWCGVELDEPLGKNDGSVAGTRYFSCQPKYGLFAPAHKVSRSPTSKRMSTANCKVHHPARHGSRESLASSIVSTRSSVGGVSMAGSQTPSRVRLGVTALGKKPTTGLRNPSTITSSLRSSLQDNYSYNYNYHYDFNFDAWEDCY